MCFLKINIQNNNNNNNQLNHYYGLALVIIILKLLRYSYLVSLINLLNSFMLNLSIALMQKKNLKMTI